MSLEKKGCKIAKKYDRWSKIYDLLDTKPPLIGNYGMKLREMAVEQMAGCNGRILDLGCGTGIMLPLIYEMCKNAEIIGIDLSKKMTRTAMLRVKRLNMTDRIKIKNLNLEKTALPDNSVDCALAAYTFTSATRPEVVLKETIRILKPNGRLVILDWGKPKSAPLLLIYPLLKSIARIFGSTYINRDIIGMVKAAKRLQITYRRFFFGKMVYIIVCQKIK